MSGVQIKVRSDSRQARSDLKKLEDSVGKIESAASSMTSAFKTAAVSLGTLFVSGNLTKGLISAGDTLKQLENRVALVTGRGKELGTTLNQLYRISANSRSSIGTTVEIFNRFSLALRGTGKTQDQVLAVTQAVGKAAVLSGASAESARAAIIQLGQGLAAGQLRGEELNSVLEQTPRVAQAIADGLGVPFGKLKELAQDGQITSEAVFNAIIAKAQEIEDEFALIEPTVRDLSVVMKDEFTRALGAINEITGVSESAANKIVLLTQAFRFVADNALFYFVDIKLYLLNFLIDVIQVYDKIKEAGASLFSSDFSLGSFGTAMTEIREGIGDAIGGLTEPIKIYFQDIKLADAFPSLEKVKTTIKGFT
jgi:tape measure domain-containing protein